MSKLYVTITYGIKGWFAILCDDKSVEEGPLISGPGFRTVEEAIQYGKEWAKAEDCRFERH